LLAGMTMRSHDQFNTTIYGENDAYRGIFNGRRVVFMNKADMEERKLQQGQWVNLQSYYKDRVHCAKLFAVAPYDIPKGSLAVYFPEGNELIDLEATAKVSNTPMSKFFMAAVSPSSEEEAREAVAILLKKLK